MPQEVEVEAACDPDQRTKQAATDLEEEAGAQTAPAKEPSRE